MKDGTVDEDAVRDKPLGGATAHVVRLAAVLTCLWAPAFAAWWLPSSPLSQRIQFFRDHPDDGPMHPP